MKTVLVFGAACLDYIAQVNRFPVPDEKLRTDSLTICGGGNAGNTSTCLNRLGVQVKLIAKIGKDLNGEKILDDLRRETNIDTSSILIQASMAMSPLTYIIVDRASKTRTCLFSAANEQILVDEIQAGWLDGIDFIHFDSRSTEAAVHLAKLAERKSIRCSLDLERSRPHLDQLIPRMNYIITTESYLRDVCKESTPIETAVRLLQTYPQSCQLIIVTRGKAGSLLVERAHGDRQNAPRGSSVTREILPVQEEDFFVWTCTAWPIESDEIVDTTGSGDAFIGAVIYGLLSNELWSKDKLLRFASFIAMCKLKGVGARSTLPHLRDIDMSLFSE